MRLLARAPRGTRGRGDGPATAAATVGIVDAAPLPIFATDSAGVVTHWNSAAEQTFGWSRAEAVGRMLADLLIAPRHRQVYMDRVRRTGQIDPNRRAVSLLGLTAIRRDGTEIAVELTIAKLEGATPGSVHAFVRDLSTEREHKAPQQLSAVAETSRDAIVASDNAGRITMWNPAAELLYGYTREEAIGQSVGALMVDDHERALVLAVIARGEELRLVRTERVRRDGSRISVSVSLTPDRDQDGVVTGTTAVVYELDHEQLRARRDDEWRTLIEAACAAPGRITTVLQPIVDVRHGRVAGYEALSRFGGHRARTDEWFARAASLGMAGALEACAIDTALSRRDELPPNCFLSVNVSPIGLLAPEVQQAFDAHTPLGGVVVELTEQSPIFDYEPVLAALAPLRAAGATVAVDDAGAGYASLRHVLALSPEFVKIDRSFIAGVDRDAAKAAVVSTLGSFADQVDAWIVAEGVEERAELAELIRLGVPLVQGYLLHVPDPGFTEIDPGLADWIAARHGDEPHSAGVAALVDHAPAVHDLDTGTALADERTPGWLVLLRDQVPVALLASGEPVEAARPCLRVLSTEQPDRVLQRAMTRPIETRFDPVVCSHEDGRLVGILPIGRLAATVAESMR